MPNPDSGLTRFLAVWGAILSSIAGRGRRGDAEHDLSGRAAPSDEHSQLCRQPGRGLHQRDDERLIFSTTFGTAIVEVAISRLAQYALGQQPHSLRSNSGRAS